MANMMDLFNELDRQTTPEEPNTIIRAPFGYVGGKRRSVKYILPYLPYRERYIEAFGGSGVVLINRQKSAYEVLNDRYAGVTAFYRCLKDPEMTKALVDWIEYSIIGREEFYFCRDTWSDCDDPIERACRWYYLVSQSFGNKCVCYGRTLGPGTLNKMRGKIPKLPEIHERIKSVHIENMDWRRVLKEYDHPDAVFYLDPPYLESNSAYKCEMPKADHKELLDTIFEMQAFVAVSGYPCNLYDSYDWDNSNEWEIVCTFTGNSNTGNGAGNNKENVAGLESYGKAKEKLWIKEAR